jgi:hypothetical protein
MKIAKYRLLMGFLGLALALSACGPAATPDLQPTPDVAAVSTQAAMTVEARFMTQQAAEAGPTPAPEQAATSTPQALATNTPAPSPTADSGGLPCLSASFIADVTVPDGMLVDPGSTFTKTWRVQNKGTCTWDSSYSLVFVSGDQLAAASSYPLTQNVGPEQTADLSIPMTAPSAAGTYYGEWRLLTPWGGTMGFGPYDSPLSVEINTNTKIGFGVADVSYVLVRDPATECPAKGVRYIITANVTANEAGTIRYHWAQNPDDNEPPVQGQINFAAAGTKSVTFEWLLKPDALQGISRWVSFVVDSPAPQEFGRVEFVFTCP